MMSYIDLHVHSLKSDGVYAPEDLIKKAASEGGVTHLAITDHNRLLFDISSLREMFPRIEVISGSEISASYYTKRKEKKKSTLLDCSLSIQKR